MCKRGYLIASALDGLKYLMAYKSLNVKKAGELKGSTELQSTLVEYDWSDQ